MELTKRKTNIIIFIASIIFISILGIFSFYEYNWFNNLASKEYYKAYNSIISNINRTANREFDRITMFTSWLNRYNNFNNIDNTSLEDFTTKIYDEFTSSQSEQNLLTSIGYIEKTEDKTTEYLYDGNTWTSSDFVDSTLPQNNSTEEISTNLNNESLSITIYINSNKYFILNFNLDKFTNNYLAPAIEEYNDEIQIEKISLSDNTSIDNINYKAYTDTLNYKFSPIKTLFYGPELTNKDIYVPLITNQIFTQNPHSIPFFDDKSNKFSPPPKMKDEANTLDQSEIYAYLKINIMGNSFYNSYIEETLSYIFLGGILLISLIGFICILLIYQLIRIQKQQNKEREFTASITHELRTPLTVIQSASDNLSENLIPTQKIPSYGKLIKQQSIRLNSMIENLLVFSKIENNKAYKKNENLINLKQYIDKLQSQENALAKEKNIPISWANINLEREVYLDINLFELVLSNLISNSLFHAYNNIAKGEIRVFIQYSDQNETLNCSIEDDGIGIPTKEQKYIFNSYYRGENSKNSQERGSGLGLFIVKRNVSILGGKITLVSPYKRINGKIKNGCKFEIVIPCKENTK
jgi:signal transduction histidine kinase